MRQFTLSFLLFASLLTGCTTVHVLTPEQRIKIGSIRVIGGPGPTPITVDYKHTDNSAVGAATGGLLGAMIYSAMDAPENSKAIMQSLLKAKEFTNLLGPVDSSKNLKQLLNESLVQLKQKVQVDADTLLNYEIHNRLSEDTKTLEVKTKYSLQPTGSHVSLHSNTVRVQFTVVKAWNKQKLEAALYAAVKESALLIAAEVVGTITEGENTSVPYFYNSYRNTKVLSSLGYSGKNRFARFREKNGNLVSVASENSEIYIQQFQQ